MKKLKANRNISNKIFGEHERQIMDNQEVSRFSRAKQRQRNVQKSVLHVQMFFFFFANYSCAFKFVFLLIRAARANFDFILIAVPV